MITAKKIIEKIIAEKGLDINTIEKSKFAEGLKKLLSMIDAAKNDQLSIPQKIEIIKEYYSPILQATEYDYQVRLLDINVLIDLASRYNSLDKFHYQ
ncbi:MAG: hypothetical protein MUO72_10240 [Bacteroidales bacterium]|nr:hypothetical protein [Bacteroidales bacterium]